MMEDTAVTIAEIRGLVAERQRFDDWLAALEARRHETPVRVFERVHADYVARRNGVISNLHEHVGSLESLAGQLNDKLQLLETQLTERGDERAEAMLRTAVGEFDTEKWEATRHELEAGIVGLEKEREALVAEAEDARALLAAARHKPVGAAPAERMPEPAAPAHLEIPIVRVPAREEAADIETAFAVTDELSDAMSDSASTPGYSPAVATNAPTRADADSDVRAAVDMRDAAPRATTPGPLDHIDVFGESSVGKRAQGDSGPLRGTPARPAPLHNSAPAGTAAHSEAFDDLAFLRSVTDSPASAAPAVRANAPTEPAKTLRCTECGTMNFPTEWYCERCGGELAAF